MNRKFIPEILSEINQDPSLLSKYRDNSALKIVFQYAFDPEKKFDLPEGKPPFKPDAAPIGMAPAILMQELRRFYIFEKAKDLPRIRKETLFIQLLESVHPTEAELLIAIKDQTLNKLYKKITHKLVFENGFVSNPPPEKQPKPKKSSASTQVAS